VRYRKWVFLVVEFLTTFSFLAFSRDSIKVGDGDGDGDRFVAQCGRVCGGGGGVVDMRRCQSNGIGERGQACVWLRWRSKVQSVSQSVSQSFIHSFSQGSPKQHHISSELQAHAAPASIRTGQGWLLVVVCLRLGDVCM